MKLKWKLGIAIPIVLLAAGVVCWFTVVDFRFRLWEAYFAVRPVPHLCKQRADAFQTRVERIKADAKNSLKPGTKKPDVVRFFASQNIPLAFFPAEHNREYATGTVYVSGLAVCENVACGDDAALIGLSVIMDGNGTVVSDPEVVGMYTNCL